MQQTEEGKEEEDHLKEDLGEKDIQMETMKVVTAVSVVVVVVVQPTWVPVVVVVTLVVVVQVVVMAMLLVEGADPTIPVLTKIILLVPTRATEKSSSLFLGLRTNLP
jgi:hypothetical protein